MIGAGKVTFSEGVHSLEVSTSCAPQRVMRPSRVNQHGLSRRTGTGLSQSVRRPLCAAGRFWKTLLTAHEPPLQHQRINAPIGFDRMPSAKRSTPSPALNVASQFQKAE